MIKILIDRAVVEQALEALELYVPKEDYENRPVGNVIDALRAALAEPVPVVDRCANCLRPKGEHQGDMCPRPYTTVWSAWDYEAALAEPVQEPAFHGFMSADGTRIDLCFTPSAPRSDGTYATAYYTSPPQRPAEPVEPVAWLRVIDEAMVTHHLGVADPTDDYETAKRKMNTLLCMAQDIGTYFAKQAEPVQEPVQEVKGCALCSHPLYAGIKCRMCGRVTEPTTEDSSAAEPVQEPASKMTAGRAAYFMARFKREEKMLGPNEQAALDFVISMLEAALAEPVLNPAPGYCKHCKQYTIEEPLPAEPVQEPVAWADKISFEQAMKAGKGHDVWPKAGDYETRTGRALIGLYTAPPQPPAQSVQEPVCDKDPRGCYSVRCQLGRMCKHAAQPQRKPLTEEEIVALIHPIVMADMPDEMTDYEIARAAAAAEREAILQMSREQWFKTQADFEEAIRARGST